MKLGSAVRNQPLTMASQLPVRHWLGPGRALFGVHQDFDADVLKLGLDDLGDGDAVSCARHG